MSPRDIGAHPASQDRVLSPSATEPLCVSAHSGDAPLRIGKAALHLGNCLDILATLEPESVDSCVCDPPYHLIAPGTKRRSNLEQPADKNLSTVNAGQFRRMARGFMGQQWDGGDVAFRPETWEAVYRVLKPGAHLIAFSGTRTYHRMVCAIEDAGFEIRDQLAWVYGSGFPKSHDVAKGLDKLAGARREVVGSNPNHRAVSGVNYEGVYAGGNTGSATITAPATPEAEQWQGWGTALKPSQEPLCLAQKPYTSEQEWVTTRHLIERLWSALWLTLPANDAAQFSTLSPLACGVDPSAFAQWIAGQRSNTQAALSALTDTSPSGSVLISSLSTVSSWNDTLAESCRAASMSTTETGSSATTELRTLRFCLSQITPASIIQAHRSGRWSSADACNAGRLFSATVAMLSATLELSAAESATDWEAIDCPDGGAPRPNWEPICLARKPLNGTVAANVLEHGTGALNIGGCRIESSEADKSTMDSKASRNSTGRVAKNVSFVKGVCQPANPLGRWPANIIHDGSDEVLAHFPDREVAPSGPNRGGMGFHGSPASGRTLFEGSTGSAARFFYCAKTSAAERHSGCEDLEKGNAHPTVKPIDLMRYLTRLVTPKGGLVLDPFAGSGSTLIAASWEGFRSVGCELSPEYLDIARRRLTATQKEIEDSQRQLSMFNGVEAA